MPSTKTLLDCVNAVLRRVNVISGDAAAFTSLTDSAQQHPIDIAVQVINEGIDDLYSASNKSLPLSQAEGTLTLVAGQREYVLATDLAELIWSLDKPMVDRTNTQYLWPWGGDYQSLLLLDAEQDDTGLPYWGIISPINGKLHLDRTPTSAEVATGAAYVYEYEKDLGMSLATDPVPFPNNVVFRSMVPCWVQLYNREMKNTFDQPLYAQGIGRASRLATEIRQRESWSPRR